jgi:hypothetical protein
MITAQRRPQYPGSQCALITASSSAAVCAGAAWRPPEMPDYPMLPQRAPFGRDVLVIQAADVDAAIAGALPVQLTEERLAL